MFGEQLKWRQEGLSNSWRIKKVFRVRIELRASRHLKARRGLDRRPSSNQGLFKVVYSMQDLLGIKALAVRPCIPSLGPFKAAAGMAPLKRKRGKLRMGS